MNDVANTNKDIIEQVRASVNVTRGEFELLQYQVQLLKIMLEERNKNQFNIPNKIGFIKEVAKLLNLEIGDVREKD